MQLIITCCSRVHSVPFVTLAICRVFWNSTMLTLHSWCHACSPVLVLPSRWGHFPVMDAGGSPFPHNDGASIDSGSGVAIGTVVSGAFCSDPMGGSSILGPISSGSALGNAITPPYGMSRAPMLCCHHFLEFLLSSFSAMSESEVDSHSHHSCDAETSLHFPLFLSSFLRWCSLNYALWRHSFSESSCS